MALEAEEFFHHLHNHNELTAYEVTLLVSDWEDSGYPATAEGFADFVASTDPWCRIPVYVFTNTFESMRFPHA